ncbi:fimbrillin family protein [Prevotella melaninogenica]|uniref:Fimbrillin family protein n=1 Tax=Prevotella melaninogenica TaxID=28132 RepID=A0ABS6Y669_9BACT|nr:fimbrillin family protein [Prevotella melaninogenica]MBW4754987.1 fimbrillin family protein [Prevotella melaninogenica]
MKINKFTSLFATCLLLGLTACSNDNVSDADSGNGAENKDLTGKTSFSITSEAKTRTSGVYDSGVNFYWTTNDNIWVKSGSTLTASSSNNITSTTAASAKFYFDGTYTAASYPVRYTGNASTSGNTVTIATSQNQAEANNATQLGTVGDCGVGTATRQTDGSYKFTLSHKASYITFMPYYSKEALDASAVVTQIKVEAANGEKLAGTFNFSDTGLGTAISSSSSNSVTLTLNGTSSTTGFPIPTTATASKNAAIMVVAPGTYSTFKVTYSLYDSVTGTKSTISYTYSGKTCTAGKNQVIKTDLGMETYTSRKSNYYMWDAKNNYWDGYVSSQPLLNNAENANYAKSSADSRWYNTAFTKDVQTKAINSCKDEPTFEGLTWYISAGSPKLDNKTLWVFANHLYVGGIWLKKQSEISHFSSTESYTGTATWVSGKDIKFTVSNFGKPASSERSSYFYLPALGQYKDGKLIDLGVKGYYWASTPNPVNDGDRSQPYGKVISANCLRFATNETLNNVYVRSYYERYVGMQVQAFE